MNLSFGWESPRASIDGRAKRRPVNLELYCEAQDA